MQFKITSSFPSPIHCAHRLNLASVVRAGEGTICGLQSGDKAGHTGVLSMRFHELWDDTIPNHTLALDLNPPTCRPPTPSSDAGFEKAKTCFAGRIPVVFQSVALVRCLPTLTHGAAPIVTSILIISSTLVVLVTALPVREANEVV
jgi:hypothetical protein